jgi:glycosyltransferase involved in cell wall biosynthesis
MAEHVSVIMPVYNERYLVAESVRRVLGVASPLISRMDLIIVDDGSTDGTRDILRKLATESPDRIVYIEHEANRGKGAAVCTGLSHARGSVTVIQDADLEYDPRDLPRLMVPFIERGADAVFGSRFLTSEFRRALYYRHRLGNHLLTAISNLLTDIDLTDMETCYKAVRTELLHSIPIRSRDFRIEVELTFKLAKRGARIFEVPISYAGRTYEEGKKIGFKDAVRAVGAMCHWWLIDDLYKPDEYGSNDLVKLQTVRNFNRWMGDVLRPFVGARVLEIGAGIGNLTGTLLPRDRYTVSDINPHYLNYLRNFADGKPYMDVRRIDLTCENDFATISQQYDTVILINLFERIEDEYRALRNVRTALAPGGRAIVLVPQNPRLSGSLDEVLGHQRRYTRETVRRILEAEGFTLERLWDFNRVTTPAWWVNGQVLRRRRFSKVQLKILNSLTGLFRRLDSVMPWQGASLIAVARRQDAPPSGETAKGASQGGVQAPDEMNRLDTAMPALLSAPGAT